MRTFILSFVLVISTLMSCNTQASNWTKSVRGNGNVVKETRTVSNFTEISASSGVNVFLFQGDEEKVVVEADENLMECIRTETDGRTLKCYIDCNVRHATKLNVYVNFKMLEKIKASSAADVFGETVIKAKNLDTHSSSGADLKLEVEAEWLRCNVSSGADAELKGKANIFEGEASSGANLHAKELTTKEAITSASSGANIKITATDKLRARASSGADVTYYGNPPSTDVHASSGGDVNKR